MPDRSTSWWILVLVMILGAGLWTLAAVAQNLWLMKAHDARRTGQSLSNGPLAIDAAQSWTAEVPGAHTMPFNAREEGSLYAIDPATGTVLASYDPSDDVPEAVGGLNSPAIGADGTVYFGVRGRFGNDAVDGHYFAVTYDAQTARFTRLWNVQVEGHVEWNHPAIGPDGGLYGGSSSACRPWPSAPAPPTQPRGSWS